MVCITMRMSYLSQGLRPISLHAQCSIKTCLQHEKLVGLIYPDFDDAFAHGLQQTDIQKVMEQNRIELNQQLPNYSQISKIKIHFEEFEKTAKKSIKRFMYQEAKG